MFLNFMTFWTSQTSEYSCSSCQNRNKNRLAVGCGWLLKRDEIKGVESSFQVLPSLFLVAEPFRLQATRLHESNSLMNRPLSIPLHSFKHRYHCRTIISYTFGAPRTAILESQRIFASEKEEAYTSSSLAAQLVSIIHTTPSLSSIATQNHQNLSKYYHMCSWMPQLCD